MDLFGAAVEQPESKREAFVRDRAGGDADLYKQVMRMLAEDGQTAAVMFQAGSGVKLEAVTQPPGLGDSGRDDAGAIAGVDAAPPELPRIAGHYRILRQLGEGGMGLVYLAEQTVPRRLVAIKALRPGMVSRGVLQRFVREAHILGRLQHPGIAQIYEAGVSEDDDDDRAFIVIEYVDGLPLTDHAATAGLDARTKVELFSRVCDAVHHAHTRRVIHRDLKPANILVDKSGQPKVLDFGIARLESTDDAAMDVTRHHNVLLGTPAYMAPEQFREGEADSRADVYALGVVLFQLLSGEMPHPVRGKSLSEVIAMVRDGVPRRLSAVDATFAGDLDAIVGRALRKDVAARYQSADALAADLRRYLAGEMIHARQDSALYVMTAQLRRYRWIVTGGVAALLATAGFAVYAAFRAEHERSLAQSAEASRREAILQSERASGASARLEHELLLTNIERGRLEAAVGNMPIAEDLLWRAYLENPGLAAARWGLWEMHHRAPTRWTLQGAAWPSAAAMTREGDTIAMGTRSGSVVIYDASAGRMAASFHELGGAVAALALTPSDIFVGLSTGGVKRIGRGDDASPREIGEAVVHAGGVQAVAVSNDGALVATGGADAVVRVWDVKTGALVRKLAAPAGVTALAFDAKAALLAAGLRAGSAAVAARVWAIADSGVVREFRREGGSTTDSVAFCAGDGLLIGTRDRLLLRGNIATGEIDTVGGPFAAGVSTIAPSPSGDRVVVVGGVTARLVSGDGRRVIETFPQSRRSGIRAGWIDDHTIAHVSDDGVIRASDVRRDLGLLRIDKGFPSWCFGVAFAPDGSRLAIAAHGVVAAGALPGFAGEVRHQFGSTVVRARCVEFLGDSADAPKLLVGCGDGALRILDATTAAVEAEIPSDAGEVYALAVDPSGDRAFTGTAKGVIRIWDLPGRKLVAELPKLDRRVEGLSLSPDGKLLASGGGGQHLVVWDLATGAIVQRLPTSGAPWCVAFSPDGATLASTTFEGAIDLFETVNWTRRESIRGHGRLIPGFAWSKDGAMFATGGEDGRIRLWDVTTLRPLLSLEPGGYEVVGVRFDPSGRYLAATNANNFVALYDLRSMDAFVAGNIEFQRQRLGILEPKQ